MHRCRALACAMALALAACTADRAVPVPAPSATPAVSPLQATSSPPAASPAASAVSPPRTQPPAITSSPTPTDAVEAPLEAVLPDFAGAQYLSKQSMNGEEVLGRAGDPIFRRLLELVGAMPDDIEAVTASGGDVDLLAITVRGVSGQELTTGMLAALAEVDEADVTELEVDGVPMHRVALAGDANASTLLMRAAGDALVMGSGNGAVQDDIEELLATLLDPKLEELLPADVDGHVMTRFSMPAVAVGTTGDVCSVVCPGEPHRLAEMLGVPVEDGDVAIAYSEEAEVWIVAFRFPGVPTARLIPARQALFGRGQQMPSREMTVGGKAVVHHVGEVFGIPGEEEWQYAHDDVLYVVRAAPVAGVPPIVEAVFAALP